MAQLRRKFNNIEAPILNETIAVLGEPEQLPKRTIKLDLSRKMRGKGIEVTLQIVNTSKDEKEKAQLIAIPKKMILTKSYIRRMMRKRVNYVEDSFQTKCSDIRATIKPFLITRKKVSRAVRKNLRNNTKDFLIEYAKDKTYIQLCEDILSGNLQRELLPKLKKIYPLSLCEIRVIETKEISKANLENNRIKREEKIKESQEEETEKEPNDPQENKEKEEGEKESNDKDKEKKSTKKVKKTKKTVKKAVKKK